MRLALGFLVVVLSALPAEAVVLGQVDTFESGSTQNWVLYPAGGVRSSGGPEGSGDGYLWLTANDNNIDAHNRASQWSGDYLSAGVTAVSVDLFNFGPSALEIRIELEGGSLFRSTDAFLLQADGRWHHAVFSLARDDLTLIYQKTGGYVDTMSHLYGLGIRHQPGSPNGGDISVTSTLGIDNVRALPEPTSFVGVIVAGILCLSCRSRRAN